LSATFGLPTTGPSPDKSIVRNHLGDRPITTPP
jgi:hypothetical protein